MFKVSTTGVIQLTRGDTARLEVSITNLQDGKPYDIRADDTVTLTVRRTISSPDITFQKVCVGTGSFYISPDDTKNLDYGKYIYDVQVTTQNGDVYTVIPPTSIEITGEVTW